MVLSILRRVSLAAGLAASITVFAATPSPAQAAANPAPASIRALCASGHFSCRGHWVHLGDGKVYELDAPFALTGRGIIRPLVIGCNPSPECTWSNVGGGKCWSDDSQSGNGVKVVLNNCDPDSAGQLWKVGTSLDGKGLDFIVENNGECMNDPSGSSTPGTQEQIWSCYATTYEDYGSQLVGPGGSQDLLAVDALAPSAPGAACLSDDGNASSGAPLLVEACNGSTNQRWLQGS